ncbi:glycosyltransferase [Bacillus megaterium]|nr:glycosyltransferase [Priestia megaterium]
MTPEEAKIINQWIDIIFVSNYPDILQNISNWYQGYIVFRVFGHGDYTTYTEQMNRLNINIDNIVNTNKYVWSPILNSLEIPEDKKIVKNKFYLNAFVSEERLEFKWKEKDSKPIISTSISYLDSNSATREIFEKFAEEFSEIPFIVLGKNSKDAIQGISDKILGHMDDKNFYSTIANSRIFVYFGLGSNFHLHFTPLEAIKIGVPVIFMDKSGLAQEARDYGISNETLKELGMCHNTKEMKALVLKIKDDFNALQALSNEQAKVFSKIFSREAALLKSKLFFNKIKPYILQNRTLQYREPSNINIVKKDLFRSNSVQTDLPVAPGQRVTFTIDNINSFTGKLVYDYEGKLIGRRAEEGSDSPGMFIGQYLQKMIPGKYLFSLELQSDKEYKQAIGAFSIGVWNPYFNILVSETISYLKEGKNPLNLVLELSPDNASVLKEIRLVWNGTNTIEVSNLVVEKLI